MVIGKNPFKVAKAKYAHAGNEFCAQRYEDPGARQEAAEYYLRTVWNARLDLLVETAGAPFEENLKYVKLVIAEEVVSMYKRLWRKMYSPEKCDEMAAYKFVDGLFWKKVEETRKRLRKEAGLG